MKRVLIIFGTRPEAIKMAPVVYELKKAADIETRVCVTAQHRQMLDEVLNIFEVVPDFDLDIMRTSQDLYDITSNVLLGLREVLSNYQPDLVLVHGDTTTTLSASLAAFYQKITVGHIEAGLRTYDIYRPWPEEGNRKLTAVLAQYHFAPTQRAKENLLKEGISTKDIEVVGNTVIDALFMVLEKIEKDELSLRIRQKFRFFDIDAPFLLVTGHRRENFGKGFQNICIALKEIALQKPNIPIIYPVHLNPNVQKPVQEFLKDIPNIFLIEPLGYLEFVYLMSKSYFVLTDSGGIQEEAPALGKPVLVMREVTERPEVVEAGSVQLVGTDPQRIVQKSIELLENKELYRTMSQSINPYGNGDAAKKIVRFIRKQFEKCRV